MMRNQGNTEAFRNFDADLNQAVLLASTVSKEGTNHLRDVEKQVVASISRVTGVGVDAFSSMTKAERDVVSLGASRRDVNAMNRLVEAAPDYKNLAVETAPSIILVYVVTRFESYLSGVIATIGRLQPALLGLEEAFKKEETETEEAWEIRREELLDKCVTNLVFSNTTSQLGEKVFEGKLNIPFSHVFSKAKATTAELDKAKAIRNIHVHSRGRINVRNRDKIDAALRLHSYYPVTIEYLSEIRDKMHGVASRLDKEVTKRYPHAVTK